ncbi:MAG: ATP-binding cassette domain-containing protein, partial [Lachnospiraceae bacterium]|nr:ATP-binding cassette domain-containing protein [Lachnospiraceae bacterium]
VFQNYGLIEHYSVLDNCKAALLIRGFSDLKATRVAKSFIDKVGLSEFLTSKASELSSGQKQRLSIARALAKNTHIIVADEPTGNLDSETSEQIIDLLHELSRDKLIIMVTHDYERVEHVATLKIRLHDGELVSSMVVNKGMVFDSVKTDTDKLAKGDSAKADAGKEKKDGSVKADTGKQKKDDSVKVDAGKEKKGDSVKADTGKHKKKDSAKADTGKQKKKDSIEDIIEDSTSDTQDNEKNAFDSFKKNFKIAMRFVWMDLVGMKSRTILFLMFFLFTGAIAFVFWGELFANYDDRITKEYNSSAFLNDNDKRLLIRRDDGKRLTKEDVDKLKELKYVTDADIYDLCHDIEFYINEGSDYKIVYGDKTADGQTVSQIQFINTKKYMMSSAAIDEDDLKDGYLPSSSDEVVVYSRKALKVGDKVTIYFRNDNLWDDGEYYERECTVSGLLKKPTDQVYFSRKLCTMLTASLRGPQVNLQFSYDGLQKKYNHYDNFILVVGEDLDRKVIRPSSNYIVEQTNSEAGAALSVDAAFNGPCELRLTSNNDSITYNYESNYSSSGSGDRRGIYDLVSYNSTVTPEDTASTDSEEEVANDGEEAKDKAEADKDSDKKEESEEAKDTKNSDKKEESEEAKDTKDSDKKEESEEAKDTKDSDKKEESEEAKDTKDSDKKEDSEEAKDSGDSDEENEDDEASSEEDSKKKESEVKMFSDLSAIFLEVSQELFNAIYGDISESYQGDVYITDYSKTDKVLKELSKAGYSGISTYRVSTTKYIPEKVNNRLIIICLSVAVLIVVFILQVLIIRSIMRIKINDFYIFKFLGMKLSMIDTIVYISMILYALISGVLAIFIAAVVGMFKVPLMVNILNYYGLINILIYFIYIIILASLTARSFTRLLRTKIDK